MISELMFCVVFPWNFYDIFTWQKIEMQFTLVKLCAIIDTDLGKGACPFSVVISQRKDFLYV